MSDYKLTFKLKQHTPYIHFQHNHLGATLRASDLKPRIDKYLYDDYQIEKQKYQLTISAKLKNDSLKEVAQWKQPYFGKHKLFRYKDIELTFSTYFNPVLVKQIKEILPKVFACENFGSFGSKGYGCFTDENQTQTDFEKLIKDKYKTVYYWDTNTANDSEIFFQIKYFYALLKSGINIPKSADKTYYKSLLMKYFLNQNIRWEKRGIKKKFGLTKSKDADYLDCGDDEIDDEEEYKVIKPLFGYSTSQKWQSYRKDIEIEFPNKQNTKRINSPIFFKVYNENTQARIYFMLRNTNEIKNELLPKKTFKYKIDSTIESFDTPDSFDYTAFIRYAVNEINNNITITNKGSIDNFIKGFKTNNIQPL